MSGASSRSRRSTMPMRARTELTFQEAILRLVTAVRLARPELVRKAPDERGAFCGPAPSRPWQKAPAPGALERGPTKRSSRKATTAARVTGGNPGDCSDLAPLYARDADRMMNSCSLLRIFNA